MMTYTCHLFYTTEIILDKNQVLVIFLLMFRVTQSNGGSSQNQQCVWPRNY